MEIVKKGFMAKIIIVVMLLSCILLHNNGYAEVSGDFSYSEEEGEITITKYNGVKTEVIIPNKINDKLVTSIGDSVFSGCSGLTSIEIPSGVTSLGDEAFSGCSGLTSIEIPSGVTSLGDEAFSGCSGLTSIEIPSGVTSIGDSVFWACSGLTSIEIPSGVTSIGDEAFSGCSGLTSIEIPSGVTSIGKSVFSGCSGLTSIEMPSGVTSIGDEAFWACSGLTSMEIPSGVMSIGDSAFWGCSGLTSIEIPSGVTSIGSFVFLYCSGLTSIEIPSGLTSIGDSAFIGCSSLTSIEIPSGVASIGKSTFYGCSSLTSIKIPSGLTSIGDSAFTGCSGLISIEISSGVTSIGDSAFKNCSSLTSIKIPFGVTNIGNSAFADCIGLTSIEIPSGLTNIGDSAFIGCSSLTSIEIPSGITSIGDSAFYACSSLIEVIFKGSIPPKFSGNCFDYIGEDAKTYVYYGETDFKDDKYPFVEGKPLKLIIKKSILSFNPVLLDQTGDVANSNAEYQTSSSVISKLPSFINVTLEDNSKKDIKVNWKDTDTYNSKVSGNYIFTATWELPDGVDNNDNISGPTCKLNVAEGIYTDAEIPAITKDLIDEMCLVNDLIKLDARSTVKDGGLISYQWYKVDNTSKENPQKLSTTTSTYRVDTSISGTYYYYCEVRNTNNSVNRKKIVKKDSNISQVIINTKSILSYNPVLLDQTGDIANRNVEYKTSGSVISILPSTINVTLEDNSKKNIKVSWEDKDTYNSKVSGEYRFKATWELPDGVDNNDNISGPICKLNVVEGTYTDAKIPVINKLEDRTSFVNDLITLKARSTVSDSGSITYQWFKADNKSKENPQKLSITTSTYRVDTSISGTYYYYCEVRNTNDSVNRKKIVKKDSNISQVIINTKSILSYNPVLLDQTGDIANRNVEYQTSGSVISILPSTINVTLEDNSKKNIKVSWEDKDTYNSKVSGEYRFKATWELPDGVDNNDNISGPICKLNVAEGIYTDAEIPVITKDLTDKTCQINESIILDGSSTVIDGGIISYQWYKVDNKSKENPQKLSTAATYTVDTSSAGTYYYYCEVRNTNNSVNRKKIVKKDSNISQVIINTKSILSYNTVLLDQTGDIANSNVEYKTSSLVISKLPSTINVTLEDNSKKNIKVSWKDKDIYNSKVSGDYIFKATWELPDGVDNNDNISGPTCKLNVAEGIYTDAEIPVITKDLTDKTCQINESIILDGSSTVIDGGIISYQWYKVDNKSKENPQKLSIITSTYRVNTSSAGTYYYYCEVRNTNNSVNRNKTSKVNSKVSEVIIRKAPPVINAETPVIKNNLTDKTCQINGSIILNARSTVSDSGTISYQWYKADNKSKENSQKLATTATYRVNTSTLGTYYYYCEIRNTNNTVSGNKTAKVYSNISQIVIKAYSLVINAEIPVIKNNLTDKICQINESIILDARSTVKDGGIITYQWYKVDNKSKLNPQKLSITTGTYKVDTSSAGAIYCYCEIRNTNNTVSGNKTAKVYSNISQIVIKAYPPLINAEIPLIENNLTDKTCQINESIILDASSTVKDGGSITYQWYKVNNKSKLNPQKLSITTATYKVDTTTAGAIYYYCEIRNTNNTVSGNKTAKVYSNISQIVIKAYPPLINAETPVIENNLTDKTCQINESIILDVKSTVKDGGLITYQWYKVDNKNKLNPQKLDIRTATYKVDTTTAGAIYCYCEIRNTNNTVSGNKTSKVNSNIVKIVISKALLNTKSMESYSPVLLIQRGDIAHNNVEYQTTSSVISILPSIINVTLEDKSKINIKVSWKDTDAYNSKVSGNYTFTGMWGELPNGVDNNDNLLSPTCELNVAKGFIDNSNENASSSYTPREKTPTKKVSESINKIKPNKEGIIKVSIKAKTNSKGKTTLILPNNFIKNKSPVELTIESEKVQVTLNSKMFTGKEKKIELVIELSNIDNLALSDKVKKEIGNMDVYNIYLKINGKKVEWKGDEDISITIKVNSENKEDHKFVAVYYDTKGNMQILKSSYYKNGKLYFKTKHLSNYGVIYVEGTFKDIKNHWAKEAIEALSARDIIKGVNKYEFKANLDISRGDLITLIVKYFGFTSNSSENFIRNQKVFDDVDYNKYYGKPIKIAEEIGLVKGCGNNKFKPLESVSRQDMMVILKKAIEISGEYLNIKAIETTYLNDNKNISPYALKSVGLMINSNIVKERLLGICPKENATRAEVVYALYNIIKTNMKE